MDILKELLFGNVSPDIAVCKNEEYKSASTVFGNLADAFEKAYDEEITEKLNKIIEAHTNMLAIENEATFKAGFILGVRIMCACLCEE